MNGRTPLFLTLAAALLLTASGCAPVNKPVQAEAAAQVLPPPPPQEQPAEPPPQAEPEKAAELAPGQLPVRFQQPSYVIKESTPETQLGIDGEADVKIPVGADISSTTGPVPLRDILKRLAALKDMNISWASDVDQFALVDVDIRAEDDFFQAIDNILRQLDYFHEVKGNTILVKYRETRRFHLAMPFTASTYSTGVGGDVLGAGGGAGSGTATLVGNVQLTSNENKFDVWENVRQNLDRILEIWEETVPAAPAANQAAAAQPQGQQPAQPAATTTRRHGKGYYTIDKPIGLITVTAPRPLIEKIEAYLDHLKKELFRQVTIEAKIVEVQLNDTTKKGIDWSALLDTSVNLQLFGSSGIIYKPSTSERVVSQITLPDNPFNILISALETQGPVKVLANPKVSVLNGQPALISIGDTYRYIEEVSVTINDSGATSTTIKTDNVMSGLGMSVIATVMGDDEIVLSLTPVTSQVTQPIEEKSFSNLTVQLPQISIREMNTIVRVKDGDMLMIGGLIDNSDSTDVTKVPVLGDVPGLGRLFSYEEKTVKKKELVILLRPRLL